MSYFQSNWSVELSIMNSGRDYLDLEKYRGKYVSADGGVLYFDWRVKLPEYIYEISGKIMFHVSVNNLDLIISYYSIKEDQRACLCRVGEPV